jgi:hypothetical protein
VLTTITMGADVGLHAATGAEKTADRFLHRRSNEGADEHRQTSGTRATLLRATVLVTVVGTTFGINWSFGRMSPPVSPVVLSYRFSDADISYPRWACLPNPSPQYG